MATGVKISDLPIATSLTGEELVAVVQNGGTVRTSVSAFAAVLGAVRSVNGQTGAVSLTANDLNAVYRNGDTMQGPLYLYSNPSPIAAEAARTDYVQAQVSVVAARIAQVSASVSVLNSVKVNRTNDYMTAVNYLDFDTSTGYTPGIGRLTWDNTDGTLQVGLKGGNVNLQIGQEQVQYCYNATSATIANGAVVKVVGATGQRLTVELAQADSDANSMTIFGVATEDITRNQQGFVTTDGVVKRLNTGAFADGDVLWLSPTTPGGITNVKPVAPQHLVMIGYCIKGGSVGSGSIYVKVQNGYELGELHDVRITEPVADGSILKYNAAVSVWANVMPKLYISFTAGGILYNSEVLLRQPVPYATKFPVNFTGSAATAGIAAASSCTFSLRVVANNATGNGTEVGTLKFDKGNTGTFTAAATVSVGSNSSLVLVAPATADSTLANVGIILVGEKI